MQTRTQSSGQVGPQGFATTHWSAVLAAVQSHSPEADAALEQLCMAYYYPLYVFLRKQGFRSHDAEDLVQQFFEQRVLTKVVFRGVDQQRGKFRSWLLTCLQNLVQNERERASAQKRGGGCVHVQLDWGTAEERFLANGRPEDTAEALYDRAWAVTAFSQAMDKLRALYEQKRDGKLFEVLGPRLVGGAEVPSYAESAARLGKSEEAVKMAMSRVRHDFARRLLAEVKRTVADEEEAKEELRYLLGLMAR